MAFFQQTSQIQQPHQTFSASENQFVQIFTTSEFASSEQKPLIQSSSVFQPYRSSQSSQQFEQTHVQLPFSQRPLEQPVLKRPSSPRLPSSLESLPEKTIPQRPSSPQWPPASEVKNDTPKTCNCGQIHLKPDTEIFRGQKEVPQKELFQQPFSGQPNPTFQQPFSGQFAPTFQQPNLYQQPQKKFYVTPSSKNLNVVDVRSTQKTKNLIHKTISNLYMAISEGEATFMYKENKVYYPLYNDYSSVHSMENNYTFSELSKDGDVLLKITPFEINVNYSKLIFVPLRKETVSGEPNYSLMIYQQDYHGNLHELVPRIYGYSVLGHYDVLDLKDENLSKVKPMMIKRVKFLVAKLSKREERTNNKFFNSFHQSLF